MSNAPARGLPPRIYIPIVLVIAVIFLGVMGYFIRIGLGVNGSAFALRQAQGDTSRAQGDTSRAQGDTSRAQGDTARPQGDTGGAPQNVQVGGGPPPAVAAQLSQLRTQIAKHPNDDVALVQLGDLYLAVEKYAQAIPLYKQALRANPKNVAAKAGLEEAASGLAQGPQR